MRAALLLLGACGTVLGHGRAPVALTSTPAGADVFVDGVAAGKTPTRVTVSTDRPHTIEFRADGRVGQCEIRGGVSGMWIAFDIALGIAPLVVDAVTGDLRALDFDACDAKF